MSINHPFKKEEDKTVTNASLYIVQYHLSYITFVLKHCVVAFEISISRTGIEL